MNELQPLLPDEIVLSKIYQIREEKVMLDTTLQNFTGLKPDV